MLTLTWGGAEVKGFTTSNQNNKRYRQHATGTQHGGEHSNINTQMIAVLNFEPSKPFPCRVVCTGSQIAYARGFWTGRGDSVTVEYKVHLTYFGTSSRMTLKLVQ